MMYISSSYSWLGFIDRLILIPKWNFTWKRTSIIKIFIPYQQIDRLMPCPSFSFRFASAWDSRVISGWKKRKIEMSVGGTFEWKLHEELSQTVEIGVLTFQFHLHLHPPPPQPVSVAGQGAVFLWPLSFGEPGLVSIRKNTHCVSFKRESNGILRDQKLIKSPVDPRP